MRRLRQSLLVALGGTGAILFQGCPGTSLVDACFGENTISSGEYDDMNDFEQILYEENDCGRYEPRSEWLDDILN